jgi:cysteine-rich repeat protein
MKTVSWIVMGFASLFLASCEMGDVNVNDFLNDMTIGDQGDDNDQDSETDGPGGYCGDGMVQWELGETCDDGNPWWGDGCNEYCWVESGWWCPSYGGPCYYEGYQGYCGDGIVQWQLGEECDDGNWYDGDGCSSWCTWEDYTNEYCTYNGSTYQVGEWWWIDNYTYCYCDGWEEIMCYDDTGCIV